MAKKKYQRITITAVPLKPEQAILSCCDTSLRVELNTSASVMCSVADCGSGGGQSFPSS